MHSDDKKVRVEELRQMLAKERPDSPCLIHQKDISKDIGLGDVVASITSAIGIKPCSGCKKRQEWLNKLVKIR